MRSILLACLLVLAGVLPAQGAKVLWFPFDHDENPPDCGFGCYSGHGGSDYKCPQGTNVYAASGGTVVTAIGDVPGQVCDSPNYGNYVKIQNDGQQLQVIEAHLLQGSVVVYAGQTVIAGQYIGKSSNSGYTLARNEDDEYECGIGDAYHLHFEVRALIDGVWTAVNPYTHDGGLWTDPLLYGDDTPPPPPQPTFVCSYVSKSITPAGPYYPGAAIQCEIRFKNEGTGTWLPTAGPQYVELASCNGSAVIGESFVNYPYDSGLGWKNHYVPDTFIQNDTQPEETATFQFSGRIRSDATPGSHDVYFGPCFNGAIMPGWGQAHFTVAVQNPPPAYACSYVSNSATITPSGPYHPGDLIQFGMLFKNEGSATWQKTQGSNYVVLAACDADGNIGPSPFNMPYDTGLGWLAQSTPGVFDNASVTPGTNANFTFAGRIRPDATAGSYSVFFAPSHDGAVISGWTGCRYDFTVTAMPAAGEPYNAWIAVGDYNGGGKADVAFLDRRGVGYLRIDYGENGFGVLEGSYGYYGTSSAVWICAGDYNGDGYSDYTQVDHNYQHGTLMVNYGSDLQSGFDGFYDWYGTAASIQSCPGDYNGDGYTDYAQRDPTYQHGTLTVNYGPNIENGFETFLDWYGTSTSILPCPADYNGDGYTDYAQFDPGSQHGTLAVNNGPDLSNGFETTLDWYGTSSGTLPCPADYNGDNYDDYAQYEQGTGYWRINNGPDLSNGFETALPYYGISPNIQPCPGDYDGDGVADIATFNRSTGVFAINYAANGFVNGIDVFATMRPDLWPMTYERMIPGDPYPSHPEPPKLVFSAYPNPFRGESILQFVLAEPRQAEVGVFDPSGRLITRLHSGLLPAGQSNLRWNGTLRNGQPAPAGVFFLRLATPDTLLTRRIVRLR